MSQQPKLRSLRDQIPQCQLAKFSIICTRLGWGEKTVKQRDNENALPKKTMNI